MNGGELAYGAMRCAVLTSIFNTDIGYGAMKKPAGQPGQADHVPMTSTRPLPQPPQRTQTLPTEPRP
eukprot:1899570-Rhodomonas_salina.1